MNHVATYLFNRACYGEAEQLFELSLRLGEHNVGLEHPLVAEALHGLANLYCELRQYEQAELLYQRVLAVRQKHLGQYHPDVAETLHDLARLRQAQHRDMEALALYQQALAIREQALGEQHPRTEETRSAYIQLLLKMEDGETITEQG